MNVYLVTYELIKRKDYPELYKALRAFPYCHCTHSAWVIKTTLSDTQLRDHLQQHIDNDDKLVVFGKITEAAWNVAVGSGCATCLKAMLA
jgi:hypothetical protein